MTIEELRASTRRVAGTDFGMHSPRWLSHFNDTARQAERYRLGRVLLAGDAAHIHLPAGGQGMNLGMQDAFNLGWKLAAVLRGDAPDGLLDTYHDERHAVDADTLKTIRAQSALISRLGETTTELYNVLTHIISFHEVNGYLSAMLSGLDIHYAIGDGHPLLGRRVPDLAIGLNDASARTRIFELLSPARPVLLDFSDKVELVEATAGWAGRLDVVKASRPADRWDLPDIATVPAPSSLLIRPDGYVAWVSNGTPDLAALQKALTTWRGPGIQRV